MREPPHYHTHVAFRCLLALIAALAALVLLPQSFSQAPSPNAVTGHMAGVSGTPVAGTYVEFLLTNCGGNQPRIFGYSGIAPQTGDFLPDTNGLLTGTIWPNDFINCGGVTGNTRWQVTYVVNNIPTGPSTCYQVLSTVNPFNLDVATPAVPCITATPILPNDVTYHNLTLTGTLAGTGAVFGNTVQAHQFLLDATPTPCSSPNFIRGLNADFTPICAAPASAPVTTVFGRAGAVVAVSGDYSCAMVTGCPTLPTIRYQTIKYASTTMAQELALKFISGGNASVSCADNPGAGSTDCTIAATGATGDVTQSIVTGSRVFGTTYHNTGTKALFIGGWATSVSGGSTGTITCSDGPSTASIQIWATTATATVASGMVGFSLPPIPAGYFYACFVTGDISTTPGEWTESLSN